jgi:hypothetical protein
MHAVVDPGIVKRLESTQHERPSSSGIDSAHGSNGKIPDIFLRAAGA